MPATNPSRPLTFQERWDSAAPRRTFKQWCRTCNRGDGIVPVIAAAALILAGTGVVGYFIEKEARWVANAWTVEKALNAKYFADIQVQRVKVGQSATEVIVVDGRIRSDCRVPDDTNPTLECGTPVR